MIWHHGTPNIGLPPEPLFDIRPVSASAGSPTTGRGTAARHRTREGRRVGGLGHRPVADALGIDRFAVMGHSGGGPHGSRALRCWAIGCWRGERRGPGALRRRGARLVRGHGGVECRIAARRGRGRACEGTVRGRQPRGSRTSSRPTGPRSWAVVVVRSGGRAGDGRRAGAADRRRPRLRLAVGLRPAGQITAPTLFVHGGSDRMVPCGHGEWLVAEVKCGGWCGEGACSILGVAGCGGPRVVSGLDVWATGCW